MGYALSINPSMCRQHLNARLGYVKVGVDMSWARRLHVRKRQTSKLSNELNRFGFANGSIDMSSAMWTFGGVWQSSLITESALMWVVNHPKLFSFPHFSQSIFNYFSSHYNNHLNPPARRKYLPSVSFHFLSVAKNAPRKWLFVLFFQLTCGGFSAFCLRNESSHVFFT